MPRTAGAAIPAYRKHRASGQGIVTIAGRTLYLGPHGTKTSRLEYDRLVGEWITAGRPTTKLGGGNDLTIAELIRRYKRYAESYYANGGILYNIGSGCRALRLRYGETIAAEFGPLALKAVRDKLVEQGSSRTYCNRLVDLIRRMFKWAASEQLIPVATWQTSTTVTGLRRGHTEAPENEPIGPVDEALVETTLIHLSETVAAMVKLQRLTGMRPDEVCRLKPGQVDRNGDVWSFRPLHHKTAHRGRERIVLIGPKGQEILRPFLLRDAEAFCFVPAEAIARQRQRRHEARVTPICCGNRPGTNRIHRKPKRKPGPRYTTASYRRAIHCACDAAERAAHRKNPEVPAEERIVLRWSPNRLRHSAATEIRRRFGLEAAQVVLGHSAADVTQIYAERDLAKAAAVIREVG
jgi:integrase